MKILLVLLLCVTSRVASLRYSPVSATGTRVVLPYPWGYNIANEEPMVTSEFFDQVTEACRRMQNCEGYLASAEAQIKRLYETSNQDNYQISAMLFQNLPYRSSMVNKFGDVARALIVANNTVFGDPSIPSPGLLKDTVSVVDGISQVKATSVGQKTSIKNAGKLAAGAIKKISDDVKEDTKSNLLPYITSYMQQLTSLRYLVQMGVHSQIQAAVNSTLKDVESQQMEYDTEYKKGYQDLLGRYNDFSSTVIAALADSKNDTNKISNQMTVLNRTVPEFKTSWNISMLSIAKVLLASTIKDSFTDVLESAAKDIQNEISSLAVNLADQILSSKANFVANTTDIATVANNGLTGLANQIIGSDKNLMAIADSSARSMLDASVKTIAGALNSVGLSAWNDALNALNTAKGLPGSIGAVFTQTNKDVANILAQAKNRDIANLQLTFKFKQNSVKKEFDSKSQGISKNTTDTISSKASSARIKLQTILGAISSGTSGSVGDQTAAGSTAADQAAAGSTAAALAAARAKMASDSAGSGLSTITGVVAAGLDDSLGAVADISKSNAGVISAEQAKAAAEQQALVEKSYNQLQSAAADSSDATRQVSASSSAVTLAGSTLTDSINGDAQDLYFKLNSVQGSADKAVNAANELENKAQTAGGTLLDEMAGFENEAPEMLAAALKRIAAIGNGIGAAGTSAQLAASGETASNVLGLLSNLTGYLGGIHPNGPSSQLLLSQSALTSDGSKLTNDVNSVPGSVASQSAAAEALLAARANRAMSQSIAALSATAGDSNAALSSLLQFDSDLVDQKRRQVLDGSTNAIDASLDASKYVTETGESYNNASSQLIFDADAIGSAGAANVTNVRSSLDDTLYDTTMLAERLLTRYASRIADATSGLDTGVSEEAGVILNLIAAKLGEVHDSIIHAGGSLDPAAIEATASQLNDYIDSLKTSFELQRKAFNTNAQQYAVRRIAAITGLSEAVVAQKAAVLTGFANADATEETVASRTTGALQSLLKAVETAKSQSSSGVSMDKVTQMINGIGTGTSSLSASLTNQMRSDFDGLGARANNDAAAAGDKLGGLATSSANGADIIGNSLADAIKLISESDSATTASVNGGQKDVYTVAGMLKNLDQSTRAKIASMMQSVQSGNMTMAQAMSAARELQQTDITSVYDVVQSLSGYVSQHGAMVNNFMSALSASKDAIATAVTAAIMDHQGVQGDIMADVANNKEQLANMQKNLLAVSPLTQQTPLEESKAQMLGSVLGVEDRVGEMLFGTTSPAPSGPNDLWFNAKTGETEASSLAEIGDISFPSAVQNLRSAYASASGDITKESMSFQSEVDKEMQAGANLLTQIVATVKSSVMLV